MSQKQKNKRIAPDIILKKYWEDKERFADLFNAYFFNGNEIIKAQDLEKEPTEVSNIISGSDEIISLPRMRDVMMRHKKSNITLAILSLENQMGINYAMPLRNILYDGLTYQKQCDAIAKMHKDMIKETKQTESLWK